MPAAGGRGVAPAVFLGGLRWDPRSESERKIGLLVYWRGRCGLDKGDLGFRGKGGELGFYYIPAVDRDGHRIIAVDVGNGRVTLAGEGVGGDYTHPRQRNIAGLYRAVHLSARRGAPRQGLTALPLA